MTTEVVLASGNRGKIVELQDVLGPLDYRVIAQSEFAITDVVEDGLSFVENALIKARHACFHTGLAAIADDSGLEVSALNGAPGIYSARYAGATASDAANTEKLLAALQGKTDRRARFVCALVFMRHAADPTPIICQGFWEGTIAEQPRGDNGFGYDPVFMLPDRGITSAELPTTEKKRISHRAHAVQRLLSELTG